MLFFIYHLDLNSKYKYRDLSYFVLWTSKAKPKTVLMNYKILELLYGIVDTFYTFEFKQSDYIHATDDSLEK